MTIQEVSNIIHNYISQTFTPKFAIIVAHSYGTFYALELVQMNRNLYNKLFLIEPTIKTQEYSKYLEEQYELSRSQITEFKLKNFDLYPSYENLSPKIIVKIHLNLQSSDKNLPQLKSYYSMCNKNIQSSLHLYIDKSHMLHYTVPDTIIYHISQLL